MDADLKPYRVEWRAHLTTRWLRAAEADHHEDAMAVAQIWREQHGGQTRVISQHVIEVVGLGRRAGM